MRGNGLNWMTRGEIEAATDDGDFGAFIGRGRGIEGAGVAAMWEAGDLVRDPYSGAAKGEVALTLSYLWGFQLPRPANFARRQVRRVTGSTAMSGQHDCLVLPGQLETAEARARSTRSSGKFPYSTGGSARTATVRDRGRTCGKSAIGFRMGLAGR